MNENEIIKAEIRPLTPQKITEQVNTIQEVMDAVMLPGVHYGVIDGCGNKPTLLKPGAEKILATFHIGVETIVEDLGDGFDHRYRIICRGFYIPTGNTIGYGVGEASTSEKKYKWREAVCQEEYDETPETKRQILYKKYNGEVKKVLQVRQNPADLANTCLKMAKKRAMVDLCLTATACSDIFAQDNDDPDAMGENGGNDKQNRFKQPQRKTATAPAAENPVPAAEHTAPDAGDNVISEAQRKRLYAIGKSKNLTDKEMSFIVFQNAGVNNSKDIPRDKYDATVTAMNSAVSGAILPAE